MTDSPVSFKNARKMSASQLSKLTKQQLCEALKDAISSAGNTKSSTNSIGQENISLESLKAMISDAVNEVRNDLIKEQKQMFSLLEENLKKRVTDLSDKLTNLENQFNYQFENALSEMEREFADRHQRRMNLVVLGVDESRSQDVEQRKAHDVEKVEALMEQMKLKVDVPSLRISRIGTPGPLGKTRLLHIRCISEEQKLKILKNKFLLKSSSSKVFIHPDLTKRQQSQRKEMEVKLQLRRDNGENVVIRHNKIVNVKAEK